MYLWNTYSVHLRQVTRVFGDLKRFPRLNAVGKHVDVEFPCNVSNSIFYFSKRN